MRRSLTIAVTCALVAAISQPVWPAALYATSRSPIIQNRRANRAGRSRMRYARMVKRFARNRLLVRVPSKTRHYYLRSVSSNYRYLRPWAKTFLDRLSRQYYARFKKPLRVTSLVRTKSYQKSLRRRNSNAAPANGPRSSSHLTGATLDISKARMSAKERAWMRRVLSDLRNRGYLYAIEENRQPTFHIMVYKRYQQWVKLRTARR